MGMNDETRSSTPAARIGNWPEVLAVFLRLGLTSFGGPIAHLGYFREELVARRKWLDEKTYADLVALSQFLPGPASSKVGIAIGLLRAGYPGALAAWAGFTLPSALALVLFAFGLDALGDTLGTGWLHGLKVAAVAVVAQAVLGMMRALAPDRERATMAVVAAAIVLAFPSAWGQVAAIVLGGIVGYALLPTAAPTDHVALPRVVSRTAAIVAIVLFFALLLGLPLLVAARPAPEPEAVRSVLPRRLARVRRRPRRAAAAAGRGGASGLGLERRLPGRLWRRAGGARTAVHLLRLSRRRHGSGPERLGRRRALPRRHVPAAFLLVIGPLPFWDELRSRPWAQSALRGVNAAVVGLLLAALYNPVWTAGVTSAGDFALAIGAFLLLFMWQTPPWLVVIASALGGAAIAAL